MKLPLLAFTLVCFVVIVRAYPRPGLNLRDAQTTPSEMRDIIERYSVDRGSLQRSLTAPLSPSRRERLRQFHSQWLSSLESLDFDAMNQDGRIDCLLLRNYLNHELRDLDLQSKALAEVSIYVPFAQVINDLEEARRRMDPVDSPRLASTLNALARQIADVRQTLEARKPFDVAQGRPESRDGANQRTMANRAATTVTALRNTLRNWFAFYNGYDPMFTWWVETPYKVVDQALQDYENFIRERLVGVRRGDREAIIGNPIGRDALLSELAYEMVPYTPEELIAIANRELAWCEVEMQRASRDLGFGEDWKAALEHVKNQHVEPGRQPQLVRDLAVEAIKFLDERDLVTIPALARETWRMEMMSPERQLFSPFFTGGEVITVAFPTNTMSHEAKVMSLRGNNIHFSRATVHHELIPGHHLQGFMAARYRTYRTLFSTPFSVEGWALYWELLLWDLNFPRSAEDRIGMLFWRMHRCARIIFSLNFHLGKMTPQECIELLVNRVGHERDNATAEVRRSFAGGYGPLYQAAYLLGGLQLRALQKELVQSGKMTNRTFHDAVLKENRIPNEMVRASLTGQKLTRAFTSSWRFYDALNGSRG